MQKVSKISEPSFFDRIDIHCEIQAVPFAQLSQMQPGESSATICERVIRARNIQTECFSKLPSPSGWVGEDPLQCPNDHLPPPEICPTRRCRPQPSSHSHEKVQPLRPCLRPHPQGLPHHRRPRRLRASAEPPYCRGYWLS